MAAMKDPFFKSTDQSSSSKRKRPNRQKSSTKTKKSAHPTSRTHQPHGAAKGKEKHRLDEEIDEGSGGDDGLSLDMDAASEPETEDEDDPSETPAQKRLRLAQAYLQGLQQSQLREEGTFDAAEIDKEIIASRLQQDYLESTGKLHSFLGDRLQAHFLTNTEPPLTFKTGKAHHRLPVTCVKLNKDGSNLYVADKQGKIIQYECSRIWDFCSTGDKTNEAAREGLIRPKKVMLNYVPPKPSDLEKFEKKQQSKQHKTLATANVGDQKGHLGEVVTIDITEDEKILASGGKDKLIGVWSLDDDSKEWKVGLRGHKDSISSISFQAGTPTLYSASFDRMIKVFNLESLTYSETLFGHQDRIHSISALRNELVVSAGGRDRTCRYWKIVDESQLVFRGGGSSKIRDLIDGVGFDPNDDDEPEDSKSNKRKSAPETNFAEGSIDCVCMVDDKMFLSGGDSGSISLWSTSKKKPVFTQTLAHGTDTRTVTGTMNEVVTQPRWITALYSLPYSDIFMSGSWDGMVRIWRLMAGERGKEIRRFETVGQVDTGPSGGIVNSLHAVLRTSERDVSKVINTGSKVKASKSIDRSKDFKQLAIAIGIGQEHRLGRWTKLPKAKNHCKLTVIEF